VASGELLRTTLKDISYVPTTIAFSPDGHTIASGSNDKTVKLWDVLSGQLLRTLAGHTSGVNSVAFSPDGGTLVSGGDDKTTKLWDTAGGQLLHTLTGHKKEVTSVAFSPNGRTLASGSKDKTIMLWVVSKVNEAGK
jgi:WD40 repeat protein